MDRQYCKDLLTQHLVDGQPLTALQVSNIVGFEIAPAKDFEERLPGRFWHNSHEPFPEDWSEEDQAAVEEQPSEQMALLDAALVLLAEMDRTKVAALAKHCLSRLTDSTIVTLGELDLITDEDPELD